MSCRGFLRRISPGTFLNIKPTCWVRQRSVQHAAHCGVFVVGPGKKFRSLTSGALQDFSAVPDLEVFNSKLRALSLDPSAAEEAVQLFQDARRQGLEPDATSVTILFKALQFLQDPKSEEWDYYEAVVIRANAPLPYNSMLQFLAGMCLHNPRQAAQKALGLHQEMKKRQVLPSRIGYHSILVTLAKTAASNPEVVRDARAVYNDMVRLSWVVDRMLFKAMFDVLLQSITQRDDSTDQVFREACALHTEMESRSITPDCDSLRVLLRILQRCVESQPTAAVQVARVVFRDLQQAGGLKQGNNTIAYNMMLDILARSLAKDPGCVEEAKRLWEEMQDAVTLTSHSYATMLNVLAESVATDPSAVEQAWSLLQGMKSAGHAANVVTYGTILKLLFRSPMSDESALHEARLMFREMRSCGIEPNQWVFATILHPLIGTARRHPDALGEAGFIFKVMHGLGIVPDKVLYLAMLKMVFLRRESVETVAALVAQMRAAGIEPTQALFHTCLRPLIALGDVSVLDEAITIFQAMCASDVEPDTMTYRLLFKVLATHPAHPDIAVTTSNLYAEMRRVGIPLTRSVVRSRLHVFCITGLDDPDCVLEAETMFGHFVETNVPVNAAIVVKMLRIGLMHGPPSAKSVFNECIEVLWRMRLAIQDRQGHEWNKREIPTWWLHADRYHELKQQLSWFGVDLLKVVNLLILTLRDRAEMHQFKKRKLIHCWEQIDTLWAMLRDSGIRPNNGTYIATFRAMTQITLKVGTPVMGQARDLYRDMHERDIHEPHFGRIAVYHAMIQLVIACADGISRRAMTDAQTVAREASAEDEDDVDDERNDVDEESDDDADDIAKRIAGIETSARDEARSAWDEILGIVADMRAAGHEPNAKTTVAMLRMLQTVVRFDADMLQQALTLFKEGRDHAEGQDVLRLYNATFAVFASAAYRGSSVLYDALALAAEMQEMGVEPGRETYSLLLRIVRLTAKDNARRREALEFLDQLLGIDRDRVEFSEKRNLSEKRNAEEEG